jgi:hypothetical protein
LIAVFVTWSQVGGQSHLDLLPWYVKMALGVAGSLAIVRATAAAVAGERGWNGQSLRWLGLLVAVAIACGLSSYYAHMYLEDTGDEPDQGQETTISRLWQRPKGPASQRGQTTTIDRLSHNTA